MKFKETVLVGPESLAITYGIGSALMWGASDFSGGFATKQCHALMVILLAHLLGALLLLGLIPMFAEPFPPAHYLMWGALAGFCGTLGLTAFYRALALGRMGLVAPLSAITTAAVPITVALFTEGMPRTPQLFGFGVAMVAVWCLSSPGSRSKISTNERDLALLSGLGFGLFFICIDRASTEAILWPLLAARIASIALAAILLTARRQMKIPGKTQLPCIAMVGILDTLANAFFALSVHLGRLDVAAMLGSMYPAFTLLLAWLILKERLSMKQWIGAMGALAALALIAG